MKLHIHLSLWGLSALALLLVACESSDTNTGSGAEELALSGGADGGDELTGSRPRRGPPAQAIDACSNQEAGASCSFEGFGGTVTGTCLNHPRLDGLSCVPEGRFGKGRFGKGAGRGHRGPPPQAIEACSTEEAGASCSFEGFGGTVNGTCVTHPRLGDLSCMPEGGFGQGRCREPGNAAAEGL